MTAAANSQVRRDVVTPAIERRMATIGPAHPKISAGHHSMVIIRPFSRTVRRFGMRPARALHHQTIDMPSSNIMRTTVDIDDPSLREVRRSTRCAGPASHAAGVSLDRGR